MTFKQMILTIYLIAIITSPVLALQKIKVSQIENFDTEVITVLTTNSAVYNSDIVAEGVTNLYYTVARQAAMTNWVLSQGYITEPPVTNTTTEFMTSISYLTNSTPVEVHTTAVSGFDIVSYTVATNLIATLAPAPVDDGSTFKSVWDGTTNVLYIVSPDGTKTNELIKTYP